MNDIVHVDNNISICKKIISIHMHCRDINLLWEYEKLDMQGK